MDEENNLQRSQDRESDSGENCSEGLLNETSSTTALEETIYDGQEEAIMKIEEDANMADEEKKKESNDCLPTSKDSPTSCEQEMSDLLNKSSINQVIFTDLVRNIRVKSTKTNCKQYQWLGTLAELKDFFSLALEREGSWSQRRLKSTTKGKKPKYVHTFCAAFEDLKVVWHANGTLQF